MDRLEVTGDDIVDWCSLLELSLEDDGDPGECDLFVRSPSPVVMDLCVASPIISLAILFLVNITSACSRRWSNLFPVSQTGTVCVSWRKEFLVKFVRLICCLVVLLLSLVVLPFSSHAQASAPQSGGGGGGGGNCEVSGGSVCSITVASAGKLILARTAVQISATATCAVPAGFTLQFASAMVQITQVSHQQVTQGFGNVSLTTCDGTAHTVQVAVTTFSSPPFHGGPASATGSIAVCYLDAFGNQICTNGGSSSQAIKITG